MEHILCACTYTQHIELTLTMENLTSLLERVKNLDGLCGVAIFLHISFSETVW